MENKDNKMNIDFKDLCNVQVDISKDLDNVERLGKTDYFDRLIEEVMKSDLSVSEKEKQVVSLTTERDKRLKIGIDANKRIKRDHINDKLHLGIGLVIAVGVVAGSLNIRQISRLIPSRNIRLIAKR